jgi:hypothetical protein
MSEPEEEPMNKAEATTMLLMSEFGDQRLVGPNCALYSLASQWLNETHIWTAGCARWLHESLNYIDRLGQDWSWVRAPRVMFCSRECALGMMVLSKDCMHICDCCDEHNGELFVIQLGDILLMTSCCLECAGQPEAFAHLN